MTKDIGTFSNKTECYIIHKEPLNVSKKMMEIPKEK
jgi:hypothetical protein